ncbi:MAG: DMT family transporter [Lautropia sp.]|nr:DMT family transporter [Lautropia sp.]
MTSSDERTGLLYGVLGAMLFAGKGILIKLAYGHGVDTETFLGLRMLWAAPFFAWVAWRADGAALCRWAAGTFSRNRVAPVATSHPVPDVGAKPEDRNGGLQSVRASTPANGVSSSGAEDAVFEQRREGMRSPTSFLSAPSVWQQHDWLRVIGLGFSGYYLASYLDFLGLQYLSVGLERVLLYLGPTFVLLLSIFWLGKSVSARQWLALAVSYLGVVMVYLHDIDVGANDNIGLGSVLVLASCLSYAFYLVNAGEMIKRLGSMRLTAWATLVACVFCVAQALLLRGSLLFRQPWEVQGIALATAIFCTVMPLFLINASVARLGAGRSAQVGMIGPVWTIFLGAMVLGEPVGWLQLVGTAVVIAGVMILAGAGKAGAR